MALFSLRKFYIIQALLLLLNIENSRACRPVDSSCFITNCTGVWNFGFIPLAHGQVGLKFLLVNSLSSLAQINSEKQVYFNGFIYIKLLGQNGKGNFK
jgi:hypothetical protein